MALPPGRRERVLVDAMWRSDGRFVEVLAAMVAVLEAHPMESVLDEALRYAAEKKKETKDKKAPLIALEKQLLAMKNATGPQKKVAKTKAPKPVVLMVESVLRPASIDELDAVRTEQLRIAGDLWEGVERPAAERLRTEESESSFGGLCEWRTLSHGKRRIDAWLYGGDSGTYFEGGTTEKVAEMVQRSVSVVREEDAELEKALEAASSTAAGKAPTTKAATKKR